MCIDGAAQCRDVDLYQKIQVIAPECVCIAARIDEPWQLKRP